MSKLTSVDHLAEATRHLYYASQVFHQEPLPDPDSLEAVAMMVAASYRIMGAHKRGQAMARLAVVETIAATLATAAMDIWPACENQIHRGLSDERRAVLAALRRQRYRTQAISVCAAVAKFYEIDHDTPEMLSLTVEMARDQKAKDAELVTAYRGKITRGEVSAMGSGE